VCCLCFVINFYCCRILLYKWYSVIQCYEVSQMQKGQNFNVSNMLLNTIYWTCALVECYFSQRQKHLNCFDANFFKAIFVQFFVYKLTIKIMILFTLLGRLWQSRPNNTKGGLWVHPSVHEKFSRFKWNLNIGRCWWVLHDGMPYDPIQVHGQGHESLKVRNAAIFNMYLLPHFQCELANDCWLLN